MSKKEALLDRLQAHYTAAEGDMKDMLRQQLTPMIGSILDMVGKTEDTPAVVDEFVQEFLPMSVAMSRKANEEIYTEEELESMLTFFDNNPWWFKKSTLFNKRHNENINNQGSEICKRIMQKYCPDDEETAT